MRVLPSVVQPTNCWATDGCWKLVAVCFYSSIRLVLACYTTLYIVYVNKYERFVVVFFLRDHADSHGFFIFPGSSAAKSLRMLQIMNVACICESTYYRHTSSYVNPVIIKTWREHQEELLTTLGDREGGLVLAGDGRCDSPGYCAKFGSFTLMEQHINKVVDFQLVQVSIT